MGIEAQGEVNAGVPRELLAPPQDLSGLKHVAELWQTESLFLCPKLCGLWDLVIACTVVPGCCSNVVSLTRIR